MAVVPPAIESLGLVQRLTVECPLKTFIAHVDGQVIRRKADIAQGQATKTVFTHIYDGKPHPTTGVPGGLFDATTYTRIDAHTVNWVRSKDGKTVQTGSNVLSADGKTFTVTTEGTGPNGQPIHNVAVYEKQ
jgi:hypothetical protein